MEETQFRDSYQDPETLASSSMVSWVIDDTHKANPPIQDPQDLSMAEGDVSLVDSMLCDSGARLVTTGLTRPNSTGQRFLILDNKFLFGF